MAENKRLRALPGVNEVLGHLDVAELIGRHGRAVAKHAVGVAIERARARILIGEDVLGTAAIVADVVRLVKNICGESLKPVVNATGVILHTNLGRSPLGQDVIDGIAKIARGYSSLEFDLANARRGQRNVHVREILRFLVSAEDILIVNNNAAGIVLALNALARGREVIISRGELIEIGGSFRIPEIMAASGARMVEVGTTNRTHLSDYEGALGTETALLFKAHKSNYSIRGFTEEVPIKDLAELAHAHELPVMYDVGSGLLRKPEGLPLGDEPDVSSALADGADLVAFSCDKLLGGPQAGVLAGGGGLISRMARAPLMRTLRVGKLTLAALSVTCRQHLRDEELLASNPTFAMLGRSHAALERLASKLFDELKCLGIAARLVESSGQCGGGALPDLRISSVAVEVLPQDGTGDPKLTRPRAKKETFAERLFRQLLEVDRPVLAVLREGRILFDVLTVFEDDIPHIALTISNALKIEVAP